MKSVAWNRGLGWVVLPVAFLSACNRLVTDTEGRGGAQGNSLMTPPVGDRIATYSPTAACLSNGALLRVNAAFDESLQARAAPPGSGDSAAASAAAAEASRAAAVGGASAAGPAAAPLDSQGASSVQAERPYCCHGSQQQSQIRASHTVSAVVKCRQHYPAGSVTEGSC